MHTRTHNRRNTISETIDVAASLQLKSTVSASRHKLYNRASGTSVQDTPRKLARDKKRLNKLQKPI